MTGPGWHEPLGHYKDLDFSSKRNEGFHSYINSLPDSSREPQSKACRWWRLPMGPSSLRYLSSIPPPLPSVNADARPGCCSLGLRDGQPRCVPERCQSVRGDLPSPVLPAEPLPKPHCFTQTLADFRENSSSGVWPSVIL